MLKPVDGLRVANEYNGNARKRHHHTGPIENVEGGCSSGAHRQTPEQASTARLHYT
jgi:hypothetical protein